jgi:ribosomal protein L37AE/L43A
MTTNPTALRASLKHEDVEKHRSLLCAEYDECLDTALRRSWNGWTCARCKHFSLAAARRAEARAAAAVELS